MVFNNNRGSSNIILANGYDDGSFVAPYKASEIAQPSLTVMLGETKAQSVGSTIGDSYVLNGEQNPTTFLATQAVPRHFEGINIAFFDGHVKYFQSNVLPTKTEFWRTS